MQRLISGNIKLAAIRIVAIYAFFAGAWILVSDNVLAWLVNDPATMTKLAVFKGWLFVLLTSALLYKLIIKDNLRISDASARLQQSEDRFHTIYDSLNDAIFIHDAETGRILDVNETACSFYLYSKQEILERNLELVGTGKSPYSVVEALDWLRKAAAGEPQTFEWLTVTKDGRRIWVEVRMHLTTISEEKRIIVMVRDITERKQAEEAISRQQAMLEELNRTLEKRVSEAVSELRQKDEMLLQQSRHAAMGEMLNNIAHQWRQPLNNIAIYVQTMQMLRASGDLSDQELQKDVQSVMEIVNYMSRTIDDFRTFFRNEKQKQLFSLKEAAEKALRFVSARMEHHEISCSLEVRHDASIMGFQTEYIQVLLNLLNNAIDALNQPAREGRRVTVIIDQQEGDSVLTVQDNGGGIPQSVLPHIFEPYFTTKGPGEGTGIGLYMAKVIIEKHMSGTISATNRAEGAEFKVKVPARSQTS